MAIRPDDVRPTAPGPPDVEDARVTVVVASMNRRAELLRSLVRHRAAVILVDNASTDGTAEAVRRELPHVDVVELPQNVGAAARTVGAARARTPFVAFADDDSWWAPGALRTAADVLAEHPDIALVNADILVGPQGDRDPVCELLDASPLPDRDVDPPGRRLLGFVACAAMVRRDAFLAVGGFDDVVRFPGEEERVAWDLAAAGWDLVHVPAATIHHHPSPLRHGAAQRARAITRSSLVSAFLRLPWRLVARRVVTALTGPTSARRGLLDSLRDTPRALRHRHVLPPEVLADLAALDVPQSAQQSTRTVRQPEVARGDDV